mmetsp:Transcript_15113/g.32409  ORF Transcript_15113/g.32409 Transcript_15113/m.32409 type:complete len:143 (-) Transcript_15113:181-609(-)
MELLFVSLAPRSTRVRELQPSRDLARSASNAQLVARSRRPHFCLTPGRGAVVSLAVDAVDSEGEEVTFDEIAARVAEIKEVIEGLEHFKERIISDATKLAKKVRTPPKKLKEALDNHPDILKIDASVKQLEAELRQLESASS